MSGQRYSLDLAALPLGAIIIAVDCWGEQPIALRVIERATHHVTGRTAAGGVVSVGGPLVRRLATADEVSAFKHPTEPKLKPLPAAQPAQPAPQMELF